MTRTRTRALVAALALAVVAGPLVLPAAVGAVAAPSIRVESPGTVAFPGSGVELEGVVTGPGASGRALVVQRRQGGRWVAVARGEGGNHPVDDEPGAFAVITQAPGRTGTVLWRVVSPHQRVAGRQVRRLVSRTLRQVVEAPRITWTLPPSAEVGSTVSVSARISPFRNLRAFVQQQVDGLWQRRAGPESGNATLTFVQLDEGESEYRVVYRQPKGGALLTSSAKTLIGTLPDASR